jgi:hypothetical protein
MDDCPRQNPAYRSAKGKPCKCGAFPLRELCRASPVHYGHNPGRRQAVREKGHQRLGVNLIRDDHVRVDVEASSLLHLVFG